MPNIPRMEVAIPTIDEGIPSPPDDGISVERGVERKIDQRLLKAL
jgi:hypothetical protein